MMRLLLEYRAIWRVGMAGLADKSFKIMLFVGALITLGVVVPVGLLAWHDNMPWGLALRFLGGIGAFWMLLAWAVILVPRAVIMNSAVNARLMPRQRRRLMQMMAGGWLLTMVLATALFGRWSVFPLVGMLVLGLSLFFAGNMAAIALVIVAANWPVAARFLAPPALVAAITSTAGLLAASVLVLLAMALSLRWMLPAGGDRHLGQRASQLERLQRVRGGNASKSLESGTMTGASVLRFYAAALRRDCRHGARAADPGKMLMHALGPAAHWSFWYLSAATLLAIGLAARVLLTWRIDPSAQGLRYAASGSMGGMVSIILASTTQIGQSVNKTVGEQTLLRLTPLAGDGRLLNRRLAAGLLHNALLVWTMLTVAILLMCSLIFGSASLVNQAALCCLAGQAAMHGVLGDYACEGGGWSVPRVLAAGMVALLEAGIAFGAGWLTDTPSGWWMIGLAAAGTVFQLRRAWMRMLAAPPAFPARRMALS
jgi:hypothetical protein